MSKNYEVVAQGGNGGELSEYDLLTAQLLSNRGVNTKEEAEFFLNPNFDEHLHDPFLLPDMERGVIRILEAIEKDEKVAIWSDYDADGIPGGALLHDFFKLIGFTNFENYIPDRNNEGYGLNKEGIDSLKNSGCTLLITIDCGIRDIALTEHAKECGMDIIITDHHEQGEGIPKAIAVINPKRNDSKYPEKILCGTGVIWKLIQAILSKNRFGLEEGKEKWLLDLVGIATLSDMVPLVGENRVLSHFGLKVLKKTKRKGLTKLLSMLKIDKKNLSEDDIGFMVTPRINAASRMGHPKDAFDLLVAESEQAAETSALHLNNINNERKVIVAHITKEAKKVIKERILNFGEKPVIVLGNPEWKPSLLGLAANSIAEEYNRPVFIWGRGGETNENGEETLKGSCRSNGSTDLVAIMERSREVFIEFGGHKFSGGFSVSYEKIHILEETLVGAFSDKISNSEKIKVDSEMRLSDVNLETVSKIERLAPFGVENLKPLFIFRDVIPEKINRFGKAREHLSITFRDGSGTKKAISFFTSLDKFGDALKEGIKTNLVAHIEKSFYNGTSEIRLRIVDLFV
jgi:single-stranded-DNA-specific exonuclease